MPAQKPESIPTEDPSNQPAQENTAEVQKPTEEAPKATKPAGFTPRFKAKNMTKPTNQNNEN